MYCEFNIFHAYVQQVFSLVIESSYMTVTHFRNKMLYLSLD